MTLRHILYLALAVAYLGCSSPQETETLPETAASSNVQTRAGHVTLDIQNRERFDALTGQEFCPCEGSEMQTLKSCIESEAGTCHTAWLAASILGAAVDSDLSDEDALDLMIHDVELARQPRSFTTEDRPFKGGAEAPVVIVEFADMQCPFCRQMSLLLEAVQEHFGDEVQIVFKHFPLSGHPYAMEAAKAAHAAYLQGKFWPMHDLLFEHQHELDDERVDAFARELGLDMGRFHTDRTSPATEAAVLADREEGMAADIRATPTVFINGIDLGKHLGVGRIAQRVAFEIAYAQAMAPPAPADNTSALIDEPEVLIAQEGGLPYLETAQADPPAKAKDYPGLLLALLTDEEKKRFFAITEGEVCPCEGSMQSLDACLQKEDGTCSLALQVSKRAMRLMKEGASDSDIVDAMLKDIEVAKKVHTFDLSETPHKGADPEQAKLVIVEFADFECPYCAKASADVAKLVKKYPEQITLYYKHFPLSFHQHATMAATAAHAAHQQGAFWPMHDAIFANQDQLSPEAVLEYAAQLGLDVEQFKADLKDPAVVGRVSSDRAEGEAAELDGTPSFFINGVRYLGELSELEATVEDRLK